MDGQDKKSFEQHILETIPDKLESPSGRSNIGVIDVILRFALIIPACFFLFGTINLFFGTRDEGSFAAGLEYVLGTISLIPILIVYFMVFLSRRTMKK